MKSRKYVFTHNNYAPEDEQRIRDIPCRYLCYGKEVAPTTRTPHLQGYIVFDNPRAVAGVRRSFVGSHVEPARGTSEQCRTYCAKDGDFYECGSMPNDSADAGSRESARWDVALAAAKEGKLEEIPADILIRHYSAVLRIGTDFGKAPGMLDGTCGVWIYGVAGCGKTRAVFDTYPEAYPKGLNKWWCGYRDESVVLLDDIDTASESWLGRFLKIWADRYPFIGESKGGSRKIRPKKLFVTSQFSIEDIFRDQETREALNRRFIVIKKEINQDIIIY